MKTLVENIRKHKYELKVFIDAGYGTMETWKKFTKRRTVEIRTKKRAVPYGITEYLGDAFRNCKVDVHYSIEDNDDTIACWAVLDNALILSSDKDYFRYLNPSLDDRLYTDFKFNDDGTMELVKSTPPNYCKGGYRKIYDERLPTSQGCGTYPRLMKE